jgi:hypothetical protein
MGSQTFEPPYKGSVWIDPATGRWTGSKNEGDDDDPSRPVFIQTLEGTMEARPGDWIIKGVQGEFHPCKPDIFEATYEAMDG